MNRGRRPPLAPLLVLLALLLSGSAWWWLAREDGASLRHPRVDASVDPGDATAFEPAPAFVPIEPERALAPTAVDDERRRFREQPAAGHAPLAGRVMQSNGGPVGAGVRVLALLPPEIGDLPQVERVRDGAVEGRCVVTDSDSCFRFPDLPGGVLYRVMAGGRGFVSHEVGPASAAGDSQVVVRVDAIYGLELRLVQEGGAPLPTRCDFGPTLLRPDARGTDDVLRDQLRAVVAGVRLEQLDADRRGHLLLHARHEAAGDTLGPWTFTLEEAGFLPRLEEIALPRMSDELATRKIEVVPVPDVRFGAVDVRLLGWPESFTRPAPDERLGQINLKPPREHGSEWILVLHGRDLDGRRVEGVPEGRWPMTFHAASRWYALFAMSGEEPLLANIGAGTSELVIDLRGAGHLQLDVAPLTIGERTIDRSITIVRREGGQATQHRGVDGRLELPFLRPGDYTARTQRRDQPGVQIHESWCSVAFTITAGAVTRCELKVDG